MFSDICNKVQSSRGEAHKGWSSEWADSPSVTISFVRDPAVFTEWESGEVLQALYLGNTTGDPDE